MIRILILLLFPVSLFADDILVTDKAMKSRDAHKICKELNWKLAARTCGQSAKKFKQRTVYENCKKGLTVVAQVFNVPAEDAKEAGPHKSCTVIAKKEGKTLWLRRHRIYSDRIISEQDKYNEVGGLERKVITPEGSFIVRSGKDNTLEMTMGATKISSLTSQDYFSYIQGKKSLEVLSDGKSSHRIPASHPKK